jgi:hypothetical protein
MIVFSKILRRTHLYLALFLTPWVLMYTLSTFVMNHRDWFRGRPPAPPKWERVSEQVYDGQFPAGASTSIQAEQILMSLDLDGAHQSSMRDGKLVIQRNAARQPLRLSFTPESKLLLVERQAPDASAFLERMHRRRGFRSGYALDNVWALTVDLFIVGVIFWALSGLWMWWELKVTRTLGALALLGGVALFAFFLAVL